MADEEKKIDPYDVVALEKSLNNSATRVSVVWLSFVAFSAYLAAAASNVSHRQLFIEEPIKLPTINIELPLAGSAILLPLLLTIYHVYVLVQVVLLARTADTYNAAVAKTVPNATDSAQIRQRLSNTLFAQLFAGAPRERTGVLGTLLRAMTWISLAIAPVLVLVLFQIKFLPYHDAVVVWSQRALIAFDITAILVLWSLALRPGENFRVGILLRDPWGIAGLGIGAVVIAFSTLVLSYPGESGRAWMAYLPAMAAPAEGDDEDEDEIKDDDPVPETTAVHPTCVTPKLVEALLPHNFDRLILPREVLIDTDKLAKGQAAAKPRQLKPSDEDRTRNFQWRDFGCSNLNETDLRFVDLSNATLTGAQLTDARMDGVRMTNGKLQQASLLRAELRGADLSGADLTRANLSGANLPGSSLRGGTLHEAVLHKTNLHAANLHRADLKRAVLEHTMLENADLRKASFQNAFIREANLDRVRAMKADFRRAKIILTKLGGAGLRVAKLQGASFDGTHLQGADLGFAELQAARLGSADLRGANLDRANLQGASLARTDARGAMFSDADAQGAQMTWADLRGADLDNTQLQAVDLSQSKLQGSGIVAAYLWRAKVQHCDGARVESPRIDKRGFDAIDDVNRFIDTTIAHLPPGKDSEDRDLQAGLRKHLQDLLLPATHWTEKSAAIWQDCEKKTLTGAALADIMTRTLVEIACEPGERQHFVIEGLYRQQRPPSTVIEEGALARALLNKKPCPGMEKISDKLRQEIKDDAEFETAATVAKPAKSKRQRGRGKSRAH